MRFGIIVFPGSNCDHDCYHVLKHVLAQDTRFIWHKEHTLGELDAVVLPGGFSYGDYLRTGALARFAPVMEEVIHFAHAGGIVIGICNGFQILCEAGLLPGVLMRNAHLRFASQQVYLKVENNNTRFTRGIRQPVLKMPIAHGDGNYFAPPEVVQQLEANHQILFRYCTANGDIVNAANPNGATANIAGIVNEHGNVMGLMPHPERAAEALLGSDDGLQIFQAVLCAPTQS